MAESFLLSDPAHSLDELKRLETLPLPLRLHGTQIQKTERVAHSSNMLVTVVLASCNLRLTSYVTANFRTESVPIRWSLGWERSRCNLPTAN